MPLARPNQPSPIQRQFRLTQPELDKLRKQLDYLLEKRFIRPSSSPFAAPISFTPKKDGGFRMCIGDRALNRVTIKSRYPIPRADELIDQLRTARVFSTIDLRGGYHQIRVNPPDCPKTAFRTRYGSFKCTVMPFGLTNAPANFQMTMNEAFRPLSDKCVFVYLDDIRIYSPDRAHHLQDNEAILKILSRHLYLLVPPHSHNSLDTHLLAYFKTFLKKNCQLTKASNCEFLQDRLEFLWHVISANGVEIDPKKIATIQAWHAPTNLTELQSFLGFVNYVRRFVPNMAKLTAPLTDLLRKGVEYTWGEKYSQQLAEAKGVYYVKKGTNHIWVPAYSLLRELLLQEAHDGVKSGHFGVEKPRQQVQRYYYWPELLTDVQHHVGSCPMC
ncbi:unnamed protein product [Closterium sp. NIES-53]